VSEATTDRELIELAARAIGLDVSDAGGFHPHWGFIWVTRTPKRQETNWNPLANDGDAFRLAVALKLNVNGWGAGASATAFINNGVAVAEPHYGDDPERATRRAIVRAAAAIGRAM